MDFIWRNYDATYLRDQWMRDSHLAMGQTYDVRDPARYVDPRSGAVLVRFVNNRQDPVSVVLGVSIQGTVK